MLIAGSLLERATAEGRSSGELGLLQLAYPILVGQMQPKWHAAYPCMGSFFQVTLIVSEYF
jgi:hypothetical protein